MVYKFDRLDQPYPITVQKSKVLGENFRDYMARMESKQGKKVVEAPKTSSGKNALQLNYAHEGVSNFGPPGALPSIALDYKSRNFEDVMLKEQASVPASKNSSFPFSQKKMQVHVVPSPKYGVLERA